MKDIVGYISPLIESQFPSFYREEGTIFIAFVKSYYEWLEQYENTIYQSRKLLEYRDIDQTSDNFLVYFKEQSLKNIQFDTATNKRLFIKNALDFYRSKGTERSIDLFFKLVYAQPASVRYPGDDIFKLSDNTWKIPIYIEVNEMKKNPLYEGKQIIGNISGATAFVESYSVKKKINDQFDSNGNLVQISKNIHVFFISNLVGSFIYGEKVFYVGLADPRDAPSIIGSLNDLEVLTGASNYNVGDRVNITSNTGMNAKAVVTSIYNTTGQVDFILIDGGWGFTSTPKIIISDRTLRIDNISFSGGTGTKQYPFDLFETVNQKLANITFTTTSSQFNANDYIFTYNAGGTVNGYGKILSISYNDPPISGEMYITIANGDFGTILSSIYNTANAVSAARGVYSDKSAFANLTSLTTNNNLILTDIIGGAIRKGEIVFQGNSTIETASAYVQSSISAGVQLLVSVSNTVGTFIPNTRIFGKSTSSNCNLLSYTTNIGIADTSTTTVASINVASIPAGGYANGINYSNGTLLNYIVTSGSGAVARIKTTGTGAIANVTLTRGGSGYILPPLAYIANSAVASSFNASTDVSDTTNFIAIASNPFINAQLVQYKVAAGNTAITGLTNNTNYYVRVSNTTGIRLANSTAPKGTVIDITHGSSETGHSFTPVVSGGYGAFFEVKLGNPFEYGYNTFITGSVSNTSAEITQIGTGSLASFSVASLDDEETVELFTDFINGENIYGANYLDMKIDGSIGTTLAGSNAYGFPANPGGTLGAETIKSMLALDEFTIGTISTINKTNPGEDYNLDPLVTIIEPMMYGYKKSDYILTTVESTSSFLPGENLLFISRQAFNGATDVASDFITLTQAIYANGAYIQYTVSDGTTVVGGLANNALYYVVGVDLVSTPNKIKLATELNGTAITLSPSPSSGSNHFIQNGSYSKLGKIKTIIDNNKLNVVRLSLLADIKENVTTYAKGESSGFISGVSAEKTNTFSGLNSVIEANVVTSNGAVGTLSVIDSGFGTERFDVCSFARENDPTATIGIAKALVERQGTGEGFSQYTKGFLSADKYIHDGDFYQDYSYELVSRIPYERYSEMLKKVLHVAGTKMFPAAELESNIEVPIGVSKTIEVAPYTTADFDFINYSESAPTTTFTRASTGTYFDSTGVLQTAPINTPRYDYEPSTLASRGLMTEEARTNSIRNNTMVGAAVPATLPTNWSTPSSYSGLSSGGITATVVSTGTENGINYIDINLAGTSTTNPTNFFAIFFENFVAASPNSIWTNSFYTKLISGSLPGGLFTIMNVLGNYNSSGTLCGEYLTTNFIPTGAALNTQRIIETSVSTTFNISTTVSIRPWIQFNIPLSTAIDITIRIGMPQLELGGYASSVIPTSNAIATRAVESNLVDYNYLDSRITLSRASSATYFDKSGILQTASYNKSRYDYDPSTLAKRGLLIEEARTNSIRNNTMKGVAIGTPGKNPANWAVTVNGSGLIIQIVGTGIESGINYIDIRFNGTPTVSTYTNIYPDQLVSGLINQTWTGSFWSKLIAGNFNNTNVNIEIRETNSIQTFLTNTLTAISLNSVLTRFTQTRTLTGTTTAFVSLGIVSQITIGLPIDFTIRIGLPQLELGAFATSVILTSSAAVTRAPENYTVNNITSFYQSSVGTLFTESLLTRQCALGATGIARFKDTPYTNAVSIFYRPNGFGGVNIMSSSVSVFDQSSPSSAIAANVILKLALAYATNDFAMSGNGGTVVFGSSGNIPTGINSMVIGNQTNYLNGYIRRITYYPVRLTNTQLQTITT